MNATARLAAYFEAHPNEWVSALTIMDIAGTLAWRTRISELRYPPFNMTIDNDLRPHGRKKYSWYRYLPPVTVTPRGEGIHDARI